MKMAALFGGRFKQLAKKLRNHKKIEAPRGCILVDVVGDTTGAKDIRYIVSVEFLKNTCFVRLLDEYEDEIRMHKTWPITLPCSVGKFEAALHLGRLNSRLFKN